jgi:hypothetical protein
MNFQRRLKRSIDRDKCASTFTTKICSAAPRRHRAVLPLSTVRLECAYRRRFLCSAVLRSPGAFGDGNGSGFGAGTSIFAMIDFSILVRADRG